MWLDPGLLLSLKSEVLAGRDHTGEVLGVAILSFQRQPTPPFSFYSGLCRSCDVPPVGAFISSARWSLDQTGWRNWPPISVPACFSVAHALFAIRAGGHTFGNADIL